MESELLAWEEKPLADAQALRIIKQKSTGTGFEMNNHKVASGIEPSIGHMVDEEARLKTSIGGKGKTHERRNEKPSTPPKSDDSSEKSKKNCIDAFPPEHYGRLRCAGPAFGRRYSDSGEPSDTE